MGPSFAFWIRIITVFQAIFQVLADLVNLDSRFMGGLLVVGSPLGLRSHGGKKEKQYIPDFLVVFVGFLGREMNTEYV